MGGFYRDIGPEGKHFEDPGLDQSAQVSLLWSKLNIGDAWMSAASIECQVRMSSGTRAFAQTTNTEGLFRRGKPLHFERYLARQSLPTNLPEEVVVSV